MIEGENLILRLPTKEDETAILEMVQEFRNNSETRIPGASNIESYDIFAEWLNKLESYRNEETLPDGKVLSTTFISVRKEDNKVIGIVNLRHELNDYLLKFGGHIGGSVRPSERKKGYSTEQLKICFEYCKKLGIKKVLVTCKDWNIASKTSIMKSGGIFENIEIDKDGNKLERYWITLNEGENKNDNKKYL